MRTTDRRQARRRGHRGLCRSRAAEQSLVRIHPVARRRLQPGVVVWAHIPYQERTGWKLRPAVVIGTDAGRVRLHPISSALSRLGRDRYLELADLDAAGLGHPCAVNIGRTVELDPIEVISVAGHLSGRDQLAVDIGRTLVTFLDLPPGRHG